MQKIALFLNGEKPKKMPSLSEYQEVYCTDGAYLFLKKMKIKPDLISGDFDSLDALPNDIPHIHTPNQNFTDFEKVLKIIIERNYLRVDVFAANGLEQDHFLGNLTTALKYKKQIEIRFFDDKQTYYFIDSPFYLEAVLGKTISLFPFPKTKAVYSKGLQYPLNGMNLNMKKNKIGTRNKAINDSIEISYSKGNLLVFVEN